MAKEIERKFLIKNANFRDMATSVRHICQGYLSSSPDSTVRVRVADDKAYITVKTRNVGAVRGEWEYEIPVSDAYEMIKLSGCPTIKKDRYIIPFDGFIWEVDQFHGRHEGLVIAEVELNDESENPPLPDFVGEEVTGNSAYFNSVLAGQ